MKNKTNILLRMSVIVTIGIFVFTFFFPFKKVQAADLISQVSGRILLDVNRNGEAWYVYPVNKHRYYLGQASDAYNLMRTLGLGITNANLAKIPQLGNPVNAPADLMKRVQGKILIQVENHGEAWYVNPVNGRRYFLGTASDAYNLMRTLGLGITSANLAHVPLTSDPTEPAADITHHESRTIQTDKGNFSIDLIVLQKSRYIMKTDTGNGGECDNNCTVKTLKQYVDENHASIGIHGTYFCPPDYAPCAGKVNIYLPPAFNTEVDKMINEDVLQFHAGPLLTYTRDNAFDFYGYYHRTHDFANSVAQYESQSGRQLKAALANFPSLVENRKVIVEGEPLDSGQRNSKATRGGIGYDKNAVYLVVARGATVIDLAYIFKALKVESAMNLDGGGSAALYFQGSYKVGPGRLLPNAIVFEKR